MIAPKVTPPCAELPMKEVDPASAEAALNVLAELKKRDPIAFCEQSRREAGHPPLKRK
jgi:hypothetical protein